ncbi:hypothetical protein C1645_835488 [Glomus cerebriforme]|uniref:Uncharacterized protein n=1 Tax=Glomus cerebriforme TaxID=658196 RepID=A0A397SED5_9GLOM|nr:hypothetical protein C1645_835488 [Glomus cerebriforme]
MKAKDRERYYKFFNLANIPPTLLKNKEHTNLYFTPKKESKSERSRVLVWLKNAIVQANLCKMSKDQGYNYFLAVVELACQKVDSQPIKDKEASTVLKAFKKVFRRKCIIPSTHKLEVNSRLKFNNWLVCNFFTKEIRVLESVEWVDDFHIIVDEVDKKLQCNPPELYLDPPKLFEKDKLLPEGTRVRVKLSDPISVLVIPDNENASPDSVIRGNSQYYVPERIFKQRTQKVHRE